MTQFATHEMFLLILLLALSLASDSDILNNGFIGPLTSDPIDDEYQTKPRQHLGDIAPMSLEERTENSILTAKFAPASNDSLIFRSKKVSFEAEQHLSISIDSHSFGLGRKKRRQSRYHTNFQKLKPCTSSMVGNPSGPKILPITKRQILVALSEERDEPPKPQSRVCLIMTLLFLAFAIVIIVTSVKYFIK